ncbi:MULTISPECIES: MmgE/PrpD family protein [unclassified Caballeronia]|uniref:MmgE/PrpD family protein n=1 Tax=unclassified Caballeronia TaxID=2646786 RepID=UPI00285D732D|nr:MULTISPECIES: MmgE/PrpD family protein [unclassified Caballeronia]MDR5777169.1 MmgE/PrpD family protein [Caballeronia sp. LZ002]MDR5852606.1 MmgE/PrpD family protein [Caballeronia sp. LZ003]
MNKPVEFSQTAFRGLLDYLGAFAHRFSIGGADETVRRQARLSILDTIGCMVAGLASTEGRAFAAVESQDHSSDGTASVVGAARKLAPQIAARINAYLGDIFELNDLTGGHASIAVVPAALALAEAVQADGRALVEAVIVGIEVTSRVYAAYYDTMKSYEETGIAPPGIPSTVGATAAAARLSGLSELETSNALSIAMALAGWCPAEVIFGQGGTIKPMLFGAWPASVAIQAVRYAKAGFDGPARVLESPIGLYSTLAYSFDASRITDPDTWYLAKPRRKRHACCGYIHPALDAVGELRTNGTDVVGAARIEIGMPAYIIPGVSKTAPPRAANEARFHAQYCVALAALGTDVIAPRHSVEFDVHLPQVSALMERIHIVEDRELKHYHQCVVRGFDAAGLEQFSLRINAPKGSPGAPMTDAEVRNKFISLVDADRTGNALDAYLARFDALEQEERCDWIVRAIADHKED